MWLWSQYMTLMQILLFLCVSLSIYQFCFRHGRSRSNTFSSKGIKIAVDYFLERGHRVEAFVPRFRRGKTTPPNPTIDAEILDDLHHRGILKYTKSCSYDDRVIVEAAVHHNGIIVSNDRYRDLQKEKDTLRRKLPRMVLEFVYSGDLFIPTPDPFGRRGPKLDEFLRFTTTTTTIPDVNNNNNNNVPEKRHFLNEMITGGSVTPKNNDHNRQRDFASRQYKSDHDFSKHSQMPPSNSFDNGGGGERRFNYETNEISNTLNGLFPQCESEIQTLLKNYPKNKNIDFLTSKLLEDLNV